MLVQDRITNNVFPETPIKKLHLDNFSYVWVKDESVNLTGTHKDRIAYELLKNYRQYFKSNLGNKDAQPPVCSILSAGNAALAVSTLFKAHNLPILRVLLDSSISSKCTDFLEQNHCRVYTTDIFKKPLSRDDILKLTDNVNGLDITSYSLVDNNNQLYHDLVDNVLEKKPTIIVVPYGSGILFESFCRGILKQQTHSPQKINYTLIGVTTKFRGSKANKLYSAYAPFDHNISRLHYMKLFGYLGPQSEIYSISDNYLEDAINIFKSQSIAAEHSGAAGLAYLLEKKSFLDPNHHYIIVNTGKGLLDRFLEQ